MRRMILGVFMAFLVVSSAGVGSATGINAEAEKAPNPTVVEDKLTIAQYDVGEMDSLTEYYDDSGNIESLPAEVNQSQETPAAVRFDQISAEDYRLFPRVDGETGNSVSFLDSARWSTTSGASSSVSVSNATVGGVEKLTVDSSVATGETTSASLSDVSVTSDADKRVLFGVMNVDSISSGSTVEIRMVDSDGDYRYATIDPSAANASADDVIAAETGNGFVIQERLSDLPMAGSGDGSMQEIQSVEIVTSENDAQVTIAGLDVEKKSTTDLADTMRDTDGDGETEQTTLTDVESPGSVDVVSIDSLGPMFDSATITDLEVYDVEYQFSDLTDSETSAEWSTADDYTFSQKLEIYGDLEVPNAIDITHGSMSMEFDQGVPNERYITAEVAENSDSSVEFGNLTDSDYTDVSASLGSTGDTATLINSVSGDQNNRVHMVILYQDSEKDEIEGSGAMGPTDGESGGFFSTLNGQILGVLGTVASVLGLRRLFGGGS